MNEVPELSLPVFILHGKNDHFTEASLAIGYFDALKAPTKKFYLFENTGHFASAENPKKYRNIMVNDVLSINNR